MKQWAMISAVSTSEPFSYKLCNSSYLVLLCDDHGKSVMHNLELLVPCPSITPGVRPLQRECPYSKQVQLNFVHTLRLG
eukprot:scaffold375_cov299-Chaetoceros_neogracile.AAC.22